MVGIAALAVNIHHGLSETSTGFALSYVSVTGVGVEQVVSSAQNVALPPGARWLICGAVALCLFSLGAIYLTSLKVKFIQNCQFRSRYRLGTAVVILVLAVTGANLSPILLIGFIATVCATQIILDLQHPTVSM
ncbi:MAG: low temperature requirement protein A [Symploca sp. SIO2E9]|nr:low temperature requirement protein A [Symploca sp. SIO2E9]